MARLYVALFTCLLLPLTACSARSSEVRAEAAPVSYVAIGASDTVGVGASQPEREGWVPRIHEQLPTGSRLTNLGVSGSLLSQALEQQLPVALAAKPDVVTVWLADNDLNARVPLERYGDDLERLLSALETTGATVLVGNVPDLAQLPVYRGLDPTLVRGQVDAWNTVIAATSARHGALLVDLHANWPELAQRPEFVSADGFHPSAEGYSRLAQLFLDVLEAQGGLRAAPRG
jgi:acyl-CoA thioesterase I